MVSYSYMNTETMPRQSSGPENEIAAMPASFSANYIMPSGMETGASAATFKPSEDFTERSDD